GSGGGDRVEVADGGALGLGVGNSPHVQIIRIRAGDIVIAALPSLESEGSLDFRTTERHVEFDTRILGASQGLGQGRRHDAKRNHETNAGRNGEPANDHRATAGRVSHRVTWVPVQPVGARWRDFRTGAPAYGEVEQPRDTMNDPAASARLTPSTVALVRSIATSLTATCSCCAT